MKQALHAPSYWRGVPFALLWIVVQSAAGGYMHGTSVGQLIANHLPMGSVFFMLVMVFLINPILRRLSPRLPLTTAELTIAWAMTTAASAVPGYGLMEFIFPYLATPEYFATPENQWREVVFPHLKKWLYVADSKAVRDFFEGLDPRDPIPYAAWTRPAAVAILFGLLFFIGVGCWAVLLRRQWIERERYGFPLVQVAAHLTEVEPGRALNATFRSPLFWSAFGAMVLVHLLRGLHQYFPWIPTVPVDFPINHLFQTRPWNALVEGWPLWPHLYFSVVGVTYFLHLDVSLSLWFFFTLYKFQEVAYRAFNVTAINTQHQVMGAVLVLSAWGLWHSRAHLWGALRRALGQNGTDDADEPMSYRAAFVGMALAWAAMVFLCVLMGMSAWMAVLFVGLLWVLATVTAWHVTNAGLLLVNVGFAPYEFFTTFLGSRAVGPNNLVLLGFDRSSIPNWSSESLMPYVMQNFRLVEIHGLHPRRMRLQLWMLLAILVAVVVAYSASLNWIYRIGALNLEGWIYYGIGPHALNRPLRDILNPQPPNVAGMLSAGLGGVVMALLIFMRQRFLWWPFHPLGYALGVTWAPYHLWFSTLVGWTVKLTVLKLGGFGPYRRWRPFFVGLILGEYLMAAIWSFIGMKTGVAYWGLPH